ncbi:ATP-dependent DNA ligase [Streptomyces mirabilis]|uniref:ATP-dependent DNA ligase n=1 Tax=Streptomyces mirabilis TaxID=68239 RepID=UPI003823FE74
MALTPPFQLMLAETRRQLPPDGTRPWEWTAEQEADGFRAILFAHSGQALVQSRRGNDLTPAFPDIAAAALRLGESLVLDGEFVVLHSGRLDFAALQSRARRRGPGAARAAEHLPTYLIV